MRMKYYVALCYIMYIQMIYISINDLSCKKRSPFTQCFQSVIQPHRNNINNIKLNIAEMYLYVYGE